MKEKDSGDPLPQSSSRLNPTFAVKDGLAGASYVPKSSTREMRVMYWQWSSSMIMWLEKVSSQLVT